MSFDNQPVRSAPLVRLRVIPEAVVCYSPEAAEFDHAAGLAAAFLTGLDREQMIVVHVDSLGIPISLDHVATGALAISLIHPREVFKSALLTNAAGVYLAHNRIVCGVQPTGSDLELARRMIAAGDLLGIPVFDHVIRDCLGRNTSLKQSLI